MAVHGLVVTRSGCRLETSPIPPGASMDSHIGSAGSRLRCVRRERRCRPRPRCSRRWWPSRRTRCGSRPGTSRRFGRPSSRRFPGRPRATGAGLPTGPSRRGERYWRPHPGGGRTRCRRCRAKTIGTGSGSDRVQLRPLGDHHAADDRRADHDREDSCPAETAVALRRRRARDARRTCRPAHARQGPT